MGENSSIAWTHHTFSPWEGCQRVSPGCERCYAEARDERFHGGAHWGPKGKRLVHSDSYWRQPEKWNRDAWTAGERRRVFCASLSDVFEDRPELVAPRARLHLLIQNTPDLDWLLLTKRPENAARLMEAAARMVQAYADLDGPRVWPRNVWLGTTCEDQQRADERVPVLLAIDGPVVHFVSQEPQLGDVDYRDIPIVKGGRGFNAFEGRGDMHGARLGWVIVGGESGGGARPFNIEWARSTIAACAAAAIPVFVKQLGAHPYIQVADLARRMKTDPEKLRVALAMRRLLDEHDRHRWLLRDRRAGADPSQWPRDLRVQQFPEVRR